MSFVVLVGGHKASPVQFPVSAQLGSRSGVPAASQATQPVILAGTEVTFLLDATMQESEREF